MIPATDDLWFEWDSRHAPVNEINSRIGAVLITLAILAWTASAIGLALYVQMLNALHVQTLSTL